MKKLLITAGILGSLAFGSAALAAEHEVKMMDTGKDGMMVFEPGYLKVAPGDTVTFVPSGSAHNTVSTFVPEGAKGWSGAMNEKVTVTLDKEGVYQYKCAPHLPLGMVGVIQVGEPVNLEAAKAAAEELKGQIGMGKERVDQYMGQVK